MGKWAEQKAVAIAHQVLTGEVDILLGSRRLSKLAHEMPIELEGIFETFVVVDSETDHLPLGEERQYWAAAALEEKDAKGGCYAATVKDEVLSACREILERLAGPAPIQ